MKILYIIFFLPNSDTNIKLLYQSQLKWSNLSLYGEQKKTNKYIHIINQSRLRYLSTSEIPVNFMRISENFDECNKFS